MRKVLFIVIIVTGLSLYGYTTGEGAYDFLNIPSDPASMGSGNTIMFASFYTNPINGLKYNNILLTAHDYIGSYDNNIGGFGGIYRLPWGVTGAHVDYYNYGTFNRTDINGSIIGTFSVYDIVFSLFYAMEINKYAKLGIKAKTVYSVLDSVSDVGMLFDLFYKGEWNDIKWMVGALNVGKIISDYSYTVDETVIVIDTLIFTDSVVIDTSYDINSILIDENAPIIPITFVGISYKVPDFDFDFILEGYYDFEDISYFKVGIKKSLSPYLGFKLGIDGKYRKFTNSGSGDLVTGFSAGVKVNYNNMNLDVAYLDMGSMDKSFSVGLNYYFEKKVTEEEEKILLNQETIEEDTIINADTLETIPSDTSIVPEIEDTTTIPDSTVQDSTNISKETDISESENTIEKSSKNVKIESEDTEETQALENTSDKSSLDNEDSETEKGGDKVQNGAESVDETNEGEESQ